MELLQLKYFVLTAKEENMTRAAQMLHIAQPALSQAVGRLEQELGVELFDRIGKRIRLNAAGKELLRTAEPMLATLAGMPEHLQAIQQEEKEMISLNVLAASGIVTQMMIAYKERYPKTSFKMDRNANSLDWDLRLSAIPGREGQALPGGSMKLMEEEIFLAVPAASDFAKRTTISLKEVQEIPFLTFPENMPYHTLCNRLWKEGGISPHVALESDNPQALRELLRAGMGVAFWPQYSWGQADPKKICLLHLDMPGSSRTITVTKNSKRKMTKAAENFYLFCRTYFKEVCEGGTER